ncbi:MAG TPA: hypothetical protein VEK11_16640 [Thermoanaerobaculia bacterium]|nr:hypothetical protein [Thermoanaerobaculia bacterium]
MKRYIFLAVLFSTLALAGEAEAGIMFLDPVSDNCWGVSINPDSPCYSGKGYPGCDKNYSTLDQCKNYCKCGLEYNWKKCDGKLTCQRLAESEKRACDTQCDIDFT